MDLKKFLFGLCLTLTCLLYFGCRSETRSPGKQSSAGVVVQEATEPELRYFTEGDLRAFFHASVRFANSADGKAAEVPLHENIETLKQKITIREGNKKYHPFYIFPPETASGGKGNRDVLILFDVSGSMAQPDIAPTRFGAAKSAAGDLLGKFRDGDLIAVAPFDNRNVQARIEDAQFQPASGSQINNLPSPGGDTALYSAAYFGLDKLSRRK